MKISTVIPVYVENILQLELLKRALVSIFEQTSHPFEIIISDNSTDNRWIQGIKELILNKVININYFSNKTDVGAAANTNYAVDKASAPLIHVLHQDDFIINKKLYENVSKIFSIEGNIWLIAQGRVDNRILNSKFDSTTKFGFNELGGPSSLFITKKNYVYANPNYRMLFDVINYHEYFLKMGDPYILPGVNIQFSVHQDQLSNNIKSKEVFVELYNFIKEYNISKFEIENTISSIKREIHHQRLLLFASFFRKKITIKFFIINLAISYAKSLKRKIFN